MVIGGRGGGNVFSNFKLENTIDTSVSYFFYFILL